jgi:hypothetical protein
MTQNGHNKDTMKLPFVTLVALRIVRRGGTVWSKPSARITPSSGLAIATLVLQHASTPQG